MINEIADTALCHFGPGPTIAITLVIGALSYPVIKRITQVALGALVNLFHTINQSNFVVRLKSMNCHQCSDNHRNHLLAHIPTGI